MRTLLTLSPVLLAAQPALAHADGTPHVHQSDVAGLMIGIALLAVVGGAGVAIRVRSRRR